MRGLPLQRREDRTATTFALDLSSCTCLAVATAYRQQTKVEIRFTQAVSLLPSRMYISTDPSLTKIFWWCLAVVLYPA
jgi:hypothetical protein